MPKGTNFQEVTEFQELLCLFLVPVLESHMHVHQEVFKKTLLMIHHRSDHDASNMPIYPFPDRI